MRLLLAFVVAIGLAPGAALSQAPALTLEWLDNTQSHRECMARAERALQNAGLRVTSRMQFSVFGVSTDNSYHLLIRCVPEKSMVILTCAGPTLDRCNLQMDRLVAGYSR
jgi:hypothetical protein